VSAIGAVAVLVPALVPAPAGITGTAGRAAAVGLVLAQAAGFWCLGIRPWLGTVHHLR
jgi:hypothetical protein